MQRASDVPAGPAKVTLGPLRDQSSASIDHGDTFERLVRTFGRPSGELGSPSLEGERHYREVIDGFLIRDW